MTKVKTIDDAFHDDWQYRTYLGDGLYAAFDGYHVWLITMREDGAHCVALHDAVYLDFVQYAAKVFNFDGQNNAIEKEILELEEHAGEINDK